MSTGRVAALENQIRAVHCPVEVADVLFVMCTANVFARLTAGVLQLEDAPKLAKKKIRSALTRAPDYFNRRAGKRESLHF